MMVCLSQDLCEERNARIQQLELSLGELSKQLANSSATDERGGLGLLDNSTTTAAVDLEQAREQIRTLTLERDRLERDLVSACGIRCGSVLLTPVPIQAG